MSTTTDWTRAARAVARLSAMALLWAGVSAAFATDYQRGPVPRWVVGQQIDMQAQAPAGQAINGIYYLLADLQVQLDPQAKTVFRRSASRALNQQGVESIGRIGIEFDPSFQTLTLHTLNLHRDGRVQDRLSSTKSKVLQRESELENQIYDGSKTVDLVLDDVRPGDIVEYAYSVRGGNPVFGGREFGRMDVQWRVPVRKAHRRLLVPLGRDVQFRPHLTSAQARTTTAGGWVEHVWQMTDVSPMPRQNDAPGWYDANPAVHWSTYRDWADVARWAEPLYQVRRPPAGPLRNEIERIAKAAVTPEQRLVAVLNFVQSQIRYLGIEVGPGSHAPRPPEKVLELRYGDCKDKVLLAVTMLRELGVTAHPALVSTRLRHAVDSTQPSPGAFNHVIFRARVGERDLWFDPTRFPQKGNLDRISQASFGQALVLDGQGSSLTPMPAADPGLLRRHIAFHIDASAGLSQTATVAVTSTFEGLSADRIRDTLRNTNLEELQRDYLNWYLRSYAGLSQAKPLTFTDDESANRVVTTEHYLIPSLWRTEARTGKSVAYFYAPDMRSLLARPDDTVRTAPLAVKHPENVTVDVTARLPDAWKIKASGSKVEDPAFIFSESTSYDAGVLRLSYHYRSLADHVKPGDLPRYLDNLEKARGTIGHTLRPQSSKNSFPALPAVAYPAALLALILSGLAVASMVVVRRGAAEATPPRHLSDRVVLAVGQGLFLAPLLALAAIVVMLAGLAGNVDRLGWGTVLIALLVWIFWRAVWTDRWLHWAAGRCEDPERLRAKASKHGLPTLPLDTPAAA